MIIGNNPQKQLYENTKEIEKLKNAIKEAYRTNNDVILNTASISVAKSLTNAGADVKDGWLLDSVGSLFKITGGDEDSLLLDFYSSLRGPQGQDGAAVNIDDSSTSLTKVWSSQKTKNYADGLIIKTNPSAAPSDSNVYSAYLVDLWHSSGIAWTTNLPSDGKMALENIIIGSSQASASSNGDPKIKKGDLIVYVDGNLKASALYSVTNNRDENYDVSVTKVCDFSQGKQLYQHNVCLTYDNAGFERTFIEPIINDNPNKMFNTLQGFKDYLIENYSITGSVTGNKKVLRASGYAPRFTTNNAEYLRCVYAIYNKHTDVGDSMYAIGIKDGTNAPTELQIVLHGGTIAVVEDVTPL